MTLALIFDLDGTLIDSLPDITAAANATLGVFDQAPLSQATIAGFVGHGFGHFLDNVVQTYPNLAKHRSALDDQFMQNYIAASGQSVLFDGVAETLARLKQTYPLGLCTNKATLPTQAVLDGLGWQSMFDAVVAGDTLEVKKPNPAPLLHCLDQLGARKCLYIGDSEVDAETAQAAEIPFALFTEGIRKSPVSEIQHDYAFSGWADFEALLKQV